MNFRPQPAILALGTAVPPYKFQQRTLADWMAAGFPNQPGLARMIRAVHAQSGIATRYSCIPDYGDAASSSQFTLGGSLADSATTAQRMAIYEREATPLAIAAARQAIAALATQRGCTAASLRAQITHVIAVSCTGFFAPGLDFMLTKELELAPTVDRRLIGFMGCAAAFNGLRSAQQAVLSQPEALALVVSVELSSLHTYPMQSRDGIVAASLFADGAAAALVGNPLEADGNYFRLEQFHTCIKPETEGEMAWQIGDHGFTLRLSAQVPAHLAEIAPAALHCLYHGERPDFWAIHPGGRVIVERLAEIFALAPDQIAPSLQILRDYGNMSSATILFVLHALQQQLQQASPAQQGQQGIAMAFGPGLVIEMARIRFIGTPQLHQTNGAQEYRYALAAG